MFYEKLSYLCSKKGMSVARLTQELNLSKATATKWKHGSKPYYSTLLRIANYFNVDVEYLVDDEYLDFDEWLADVKHTTRAEVLHDVKWLEDERKTDAQDMLNQLNQGIKKEQG